MKLFLVPESGPLTVHLGMSTYQGICCPLSSACVWRLALRGLSLYKRGLTREGDLVHVLLYRGTSGDTAPCGMTGVTLLDKSHPS